MILEVNNTIEMASTILVRLPYDGLYNSLIEFKRVSLD